MPRFRFDDPWRVLWQIVTSDYLLGAVLLTLTLALLLAAWLPQASAGGSASDVAWQAEVQRRFGGVAWFDVARPLLQVMGAFHVADAPGFRFLLALLVLSLLARLVDSIEGLWQGRQGGAPPEGASWVAVDVREPPLTPGGPPGQVRAGESNERIFEELVAGLRRQRFRVVIEDEEGEDQKDAVVCADRWPWGELGPVSVYLGGLMVLLGAAVAALWGWQTEPLPVTTSESVPLGHGSNLTLRLDELAPDGRRGVGEIWHEEDTLVGAGDLTVGRPLAGGGVGAYLVGSGPGLRVRATLNETQVLELATGPDRERQEGVVLIFTEAEPRHLVGVPEADLVLLLTMSHPGQVGTLPRVQVFDSGSDQFILEQDAPTDATLTVGDISFVLTPVPYAEIRLVHDLGAFWSQLGVVWLIAGALLWGLWPPRRLWLRRQTGSVKLAGGIEVVGDVSLLSPLESKPTQLNGGEV